LRFYKYSGNTGTHVGNLWTATGTRLATVTFANETASGWQQVTLPTPVAIAANTTYVASYHTSVGRYGATSGYFATAGVDNGPLHALRNGVDGGNGVYRYGSTSAFPTQTYNSANYWVDIVFSPSAPDTTPPTVGSVSPVAGAANVNVMADITAAFSEAMDPATVTGTTFELRDPANVLVPAAVTYGAATRTATLNPSAALAYSTTYTARVRGGSTDPRVKDLSGNALAADVSWSFTTSAAPATASSITIADASVVEGHAGTVSAMFSVNLSATSPDTVTVAFATANGTAAAPGDYAAASGTVTFAPGVTAQTITVSIIGDTLDEPNETFGVNLSNPTGATIADGQAIGTITDDDAPPAISIGDVTVTEGNTGSVSVAFTVSLSAASGQVVSAAYATANGTAAAGSDYTAASGTATFAAGTTTQTVTVAVTGDLVDEPNETFVVNLSSAVNATLADSQGAGTIVDDDPPPSSCPCTIWSSTATPAAQDPDTSAVEVGVKFRADSAGYITALRFYKYSGNTGTHIGNLWTATGTRLATVTFANETASGWQQVTLPTPVAIAANTTYIASYHTGVGRYGATSGYFATAGVDNRPLHALRNGVDGGNGVYRYGSTSGFPTQTYNSTNYWVDIVFSPTVP
jgi:hypothetical protein